MLTREPSFSRASTIGRALVDAAPDPRRDALAHMGHVRRHRGSARRTASSLPRRSTNTLSGPLTMMSVIRSSSSSGSSGPSPSMSLTSSRASARCSRPLSWMRFCVAISASVRSTSWVSSSGVSFASEVGSISPRHSVRNSTIAAPGGSLGGRRWFGLLDGQRAARCCLAATEPDRGSSLNPRTASFTVASAATACLHPRCSERRWPLGRAVNRKCGCRLSGQRDDPLVELACSARPGSPMLAAFSTNFGRSGIAMSTFIFSASSIC